MNQFSIIVKLEIEKLFENWKLEIGNLKDILNITSYNFLKN